MNSKENELFNKRFEYALVILGVLFASSYFSISSVHSLLGQYNNDLINNFNKYGFLPIEDMPKLCLRYWLLSFEGISILLGGFLIFFIFLRGLYISKIFKSEKTKKKIYSIANQMFNDGVIAFPSFILLFTIITIYLFLIFFVSINFPSYSTILTSEVIVLIGFIIFFLLSLVFIYFSTKYLSLSQHTYHLILFLLFVVFCIDWWLNSTLSLLPWAN